jgi:hypothetical protein
MIRSRTGPRRFSVPSPVFNDNGNRINFFRVCACRTMLDACRRCANGRWNSARISGRSRGRPPSDCDRLSDPRDHRDPAFGLAVGRVLDKAVSDRELRAVPRLLGAVRVFDQLLDDDRVPRRAGVYRGVFIPLAMTIVLRSPPLAKQPIGLALFGITATFAPTIGGWVTETVS